MDQNRTAVTRAATGASGAGSRPARDAAFEGAANERTRTATAIPARRGF
jgi:hypothetical protein